MNKPSISIQDLMLLYFGKLAQFDVEILMSFAFKKSREFILSHPEYAPSTIKMKRFKAIANRRSQGEPIAYILGHKEFYGLDFVVNNCTLVPRPETEMIIEDVLSLLRNMSRGTTVIDLGTGSGNIIISVAHTFENDAQYYASDISEGALKIARKNAKVHQVEKKIKFIEGSLLTPFLQTKKITSEDLIITANLPYLSKDIYNSAPIDVKKFEPKSALYSPEAGLQHYRKLLEQLKKLVATNSLSSVTLFLEISPEQKTLLPKIIKTILPFAKIEFQKDLARKWRVCKIDIAMSSRT